MDAEPAGLRWNVRHVRSNEFEAWTNLFGGYATFYDWPMSEPHARQIWQWIHAGKAVECLVAVATDDNGDEIGGPAGLAHLRQWVRPLRGTINGYLDDLYVDPGRRGSGVARALFDEIKLLAVERGWAIVRWTTADNNYRARSVYDQVATRTTWITYDMDCQLRSDSRGLT